MARFTPTAHALLSTKARTLDEPALTAHTDMAEARLGLVGATVSGGDVDRVTTAVALQVNLQVEKGVNAHVYSSLSRGKRTFDYRKLADLDVHRDAVAIVANVLGVAARFPALTSRRGMNIHG